MRAIPSLFLLVSFYMQNTLAQEYDYESISKRFTSVQLDSKAVKRAQMEGECLVGLKNLNFKNKTEFDPVAEWTNYRSFSLLEQSSPCTVLIIMEVAKSKLTATH